jgi:hypothetical protein
MKMSWESARKISLVGGESWVEARDTPSLTNGQLDTAGLHMRGRPVPADQLLPC